MHASHMSPSQHHPATVAMIIGTQRLVRAGMMLVLPRLDIEVGMEVYVRTLEPIVASTSVRLRSGYALATVLGHPKCPRVAITKHRRRKHHRRSMTHRQHSTALVVGQAAYPHDGTEEGRRNN
ncbi:50S ribosomal protein L21 [Candidatus Tremblaya princeps]|uniref:50S ribosomal protein L21 n=1 Tax=Tremblaya princeps TaxID=189385 RepID=A0A143WQ75_TREPR|nr:50S ribosomal protein L21 [Candidatus Tremblaya princeps]